MLGKSSLIAFVPTRDAARSRMFYEDTLGLRFVSDDSFAVVMDAKGTMIRIVRLGEFTPAPYTIVGWQVEDIHQTIAAMSGKDIEFKRYPYFEQSEDGVWSAPDGAQVAWFSDPDGNTLSISEPV